MENIGDYLKTVRESLNLTIEDISSQTRIKIYIIEQIENNDYMAIGDVGFVKIMIITYCRAINGDEELVQSRLTQMFDAPSDPPIKITGAKNKKAVIISPNVIYFILLGMLIICLAVAIAHLYRNEAFSFNAIREQLATTERRTRPIPQVSELTPDSLWIMQRRIFYETNEIIAGEERQIPRTTRTNIIRRSNNIAVLQEVNTPNYYIFDDTDYVGELIFSNMVSPLNPEILELPVILVDAEIEEED